MSDNATESQTSNTPAATQPRYGARVFLHDDGVILVKQTIKSGPNQTDAYVIDEQRERFVDPGNDAELGAAVRDAVNGRL